MSVRANWIRGFICINMTSCIGYEFQFTLNAWKHLLVTLHCTTLHYVGRHFTRNFSSPPFGVGHLDGVMTWLPQLPMVTVNKCNSFPMVLEMADQNISPLHPDRQDRLVVRKATYGKIMDYVDTLSFSCCKASGHFATGSGLVSGSALYIAVLM